MIKNTKKFNLKFKYLPLPICSLSEPGPVPIKNILQENNIRYADLELSNWLEYRMANQSQSAKQN